MLHERGGVELATESRALRRTGHFGDPRDDVQRQMRLADPQVDTVRFLDDLDAESAEPDESPHTGRGSRSTYGSQARRPGAPMCTSAASRPATNKPTAHHQTGTHRRSEYSTGEVLSVGATSGRDVCDTRPG